MPPARATGSRTRRWLAELLALLASWCSPCGAGELFRDDFSGFPPGWLTRPVGQLNAAIQEYHYLPHRGVPLGPWANAICHLDAWAVGEEDGHSYLEQHTVNDQSRLMNPIFLTGDPEWSDYAVEVGVRPLSLDDMAGVVFRYHTNRHYYLFALTGGKRARLALRLPLEKVFRVAEWRELGTADFPYDTTRYYRLRVENEGPTIRASIDGKLILTADDGELVRGKAGVTANVPARFQDFHVTAPDAVKAQIEKRVALREAELRRAARPEPAAQVVEAVRHPQVRGRAERAVRRSRRRRRAGDAHRSEHPPDRRQLHPDQLPDGCDLGRQGTLATGPARPAQRPSDRRYSLPDSRPRRRRPERGRDGEGFQAPGSRRQHRTRRTWVWMPEALPDNGKKPFTLTNGDSLAFLNFSGQPGAASSWSRTATRTSGSSTAA